MGRIGAGGQTSSFGCRGRLGWGSVSDAEPKKITQDEKNFCAEAYHKFCGEYGLDSAALRDCMDRNGRARHITASRHSLSRRRVEKRSGPPQEQRSVNSRAAVGLGISVRLLDIEAFKINRGMSLPFGIGDANLRSPKPINSRAVCNSSVRVLLPNRTAPSWAHSRDGIWHSIGSMLSTKLIGAEGNAKPSRVRQFRTEALPRRRTPGPQTIQPKHRVGGRGYGLRPRHAFCCYLIAG